MMIVASNSLTISNVNDGTIVHIAYANSADGVTNFSTSDSNRTYIGMYVDFNVNDSTTPSDYSWTLVKGADGSQGTPGKPGTDGKTPYLHTAYSWSADGTDRFTTVYPGENLVDRTKTMSGYVIGSNGLVAQPSTVNKELVTDYLPVDSGQVMYMQQRVTVENPGGDAYGWWGIGYYDENKTFISRSGGGSKPAQDGTEVYFGSKSTTPDNAHFMRVSWRNYNGSKIKVEVGEEPTVYTTAPSEDMSNAYPSYLGTYTDYTADDSTDPSKYTWAKLRGEQGPKGDTGEDGVAGKDGVGIKSTAVTYQASTSGTTAPTGTWVASPTAVAGQYQWTRTVWTYTDGTAEVGYSVGHIGVDGATGKDGIAGKDGVGIKSTAITYASSTSGTSAPTSGWVSTPPSATAGQFIWTRTIWTYTDNTTETGYSVGKIGEKGATGANGAPGKPGADGRTPYFHQAWADSKDGRVNFSTTDPTNRGYLGTYSDFTQADSTDPIKYFWVELVGAIEVGGRNLLLGTRDFSSINIQGHKVAITNGQETFQAATGTQGSGATYDIATFNGLTLEKDTDYTASFWAKTSENTDIWSYLYDSGSNGNYSDGSTKNQATTDYTRFVVHFHNGNNTATPSFIPVRIQKPGVTVWVYGCMLERGNKATDWSPAPEDTQEQIDTINQGLVDTNSKINAVTKIDSQATTPTNPKKGDQWWVKDANGNINAFKIWDGTKWADSIIQQSAMNISTLNGNIINGATINGSEFNTAYSGIKKTIVSGYDVTVDGAIKIGDGAITNNYKYTNKNSPSSYTPRYGQLKITGDTISNHQFDASGTEVTTWQIDPSTGMLFKVGTQTAQFGTSSIVFNDTAAGSTMLSSSGLQLNTKNNESILLNSLTNGFQILSRRPDGGYGDAVLDLKGNTSGINFHVGARADIPHDARITVEGRYGNWPASDRARIHLWGNNVVLHTFDAAEVRDGTGELAAYKSIRASAFTVSSNPKYKTNVKPFENGLNVVNGVDIFNYSLKSDLDNGKYSNHIGMMLDNAPEEIVTDSEGVDLYSAVSVLWKAVQELSAKVDTLESQLEDKEE